MDQRLVELSAWVAQHLNLPNTPLEAVSGDASFRRYFRYTSSANDRSLRPELRRSYIAMDAPPDKEDSSGFIAIATHWFAEGVAVPEVIHADLDRGFILLSDLGDHLLLEALNDKAPDLDAGDRYYSLAIESLMHIQGLSAPQGYEIPPYDSALLQREMSLFPDWLLGKKLGIDLTSQENDMLSRTFSILEERALRQQQVLVHRDYHARNLMVLGDQRLGVIDFQDAVYGPITYDLVSLLRDCYIVWPKVKVEQWCSQFYELAKPGVDFKRFKKDFDYMGLQRHLKASGIFARLSLRDGKHGYLNDIPRVLDYLLVISRDYEELMSFSSFLQQRVLPRLSQLGATSS